MSFSNEMNQQTQPNRWKWVRIVAPIALLLAICTVATAYFPKGAKANKTAAAGLRTNVTLPPSVTATDPGPRPLPANAGNFLASLSANEQQIEPSITTEFNRAHDVLVTSPTDGGLGPRFNGNSCAQCHAYPAVGGSSPPNNPLFSLYNAKGATNTMPFFETSTGPILEARFINQPGTTTPDGTVHQLFTIKGRTDGGSCGITQPDFTTAASQGNLALRQVSPTYGDGLIEVVRNIDIINNMNANLTQKASLGITGHPVYSGNDGSIQRFGWKAQVRSTLIMAAQQMNVEMGVTNETFPNEMDQTAGCVLNPVPETVTNFTPGILTEMFPGDSERTEYFIQWMAPPTPGPSSSSTKNGKTQFTNAGCVYCHTTSFKTPPTSRPALGNATINLYSDLLVHHMGPGLADGLAQGSAGPDEFRTAPLWGIGQRLWFMHDGRTNNIVTAIEDHMSLGNTQYPASEANQAVTNFNNLSSKNQQDLVNFLRSL
ncbi:MAG TPA: di-heme oxidoredictase family protein [Candidatus Dormibacteraeota bacterium]|nr:di-heme oxidoredictase family protein [Candidatus Dormibacteraeota bacterium]